MDVRYTGFAGQLKRMLSRRGASQGWLAREMGVTPQAVHSWCRGQYLPGVLMLSRLVATLDAPGLVDHWRAERERKCAWCGTSFVARLEKQRFCASLCQRSYWKAERHRETRESNRRRDSIEQRLIERLKRDNAAYADAIAAFCNACEWDRLCKTPSCELRPKSPLPLEAVA